uniref:Uncharacterized protein n=1 Tax=Tanacetum cinerariifolium TaxID=118510 RepID=A0A6L2NWD9_TANCI|nr:hypothetical protein [Tanacetum cinerariifolium]
MGQDVEAFEDVIEDEPHFITEIDNNDLRGLLVPNVRSCGGNGGRGGSMVERGEKISSTGCTCMVNREDCLEGCNGDGGGKVNGDGVDLGVLKSSSGGIPGETIGERGGVMMGHGVGPI